MNHRIGIAVWGVGRHAQKSILPAIASSSVCRLAGILTRNTSVANEESARFGCAAFANADEMLSDGAVDAVYISSPTAIHGGAARLALAQGKHVLVEKTAFSSLAETLEMIAQARAANCALMEAFMYRFHPQFLALKKIVETERFGALLQGWSRFGFPHLDSADFRYRRDLGGGALNDAGAYTLNLAAELLGPQSECAWSSTSSEAGFEVDTRGTSIVTDERQRQVACAWAFGGSYVNQVDLWCEGAHLRGSRFFSKPDTLVSSIEVAANGKTVEVLEIQAENHFVKMLEHFAGSLLDDSIRVAEYRKLEQQARLMQSVRARG